MQNTDIPSKIVLPWAGAGSHNTIPVPTQVGITPGKASWTTGFPPLTMQPLSSGGVPPFGLDMNGFAYEVSAWVRWGIAGGFTKFDAAFAADANVNGYPTGAVVQSADNSGFWRSTSNNNTANPDTNGAGWVPGYHTGIATQALTNVNVTLTLAQYAKPIIILSGTLSGNVQVIMPNLAVEWLFVNNTTGAFTITVKTAAGTGPVLAAGANLVYGDATDILSAFSRNLASLTGNGYEIGSSGRIMQWGTYTSDIVGGSPATVTFPIAFPNACLVALPVPRNPTPDGSADAWLTLRSKTTANFVVGTDWAGSGGSDVVHGADWLAIGW